MTSMGDKYITISGICQSIFILLSFYLEGLNRGLVAIAGNFIGARRFHLIPKVMRSGLILQIGFSLFVMLGLTLYPEYAIYFFGSNEILQEVPVGSTQIVLDSAMRNCLMLTSLYVLFEGIRWVFAGLLTAAGDTIFILITGAVSVWLFLLLPLYFIVVKNQLPVEAAWIVAAIFSALTSAIFWARYRSEKWKRVDLLQKDWDIPVQEDSSTISEEPSEIS